MRAEIELDKSLETRSAGSRAPAGVPPQRSVVRYWHVGAIIAVLVLIGFVRYRLKDSPLERDEGEYAYVGQLMLQGVPPYKLAYNMKLPGTYAAYAAILAAFGQTPGAIHLGLMLINAATAILLYFLGARLCGRTAGVVACACYTLLSAGQAVLGTAAHATHFVVLCASAGSLLLLAAIENKRMWLYGASGAFLGLSFLMKQPGILFVLFGFLCLIFSDSRQLYVERGQTILRAALFLLASAAPFAVTCLILYATGVFGRFWFWTFTYAGQYASLMGISHGLQELAATFPKVTGPCLGIWVIAAAGLTATFWNRSLRSRRVFILGFTLSSIIAVCPGLFFRPHYFILLLPAVALLAGLAIDSAAQSLRRRGIAMRAVPILTFLLVFAFSISRQGRFFFQVDPVTACREIYGPVGFAESRDIAEYLRAHTPEDARIAVLGSEPQIYFFSRRRAATGYIYVYALMEPQPYALEMQREMIREIESARPEYIVISRVASSWTRWLNSERFLDSWIAAYAAENYIPDGIVELDDKGPAVFRWGDEARSYRPASALRLELLKRRK